MANSDGIQSRPPYLNAWEVKAVSSCKLDASRPRGQYTKELAGRGERFVGGCVHSDGSAAFPLTDEHRMLLQIRDTLYEGNWNDFLRDLNARAQNRPHVFEIVPTSPEMKSTIAHHLALIEQMRNWETDHDCVLRANPAA